MQIQKLLPLPIKVTLLTDLSKQIGPLMGGGGGGGAVSRVYFKNGCVSRVTSNDRPRNIVNYTGSNVIFH